MKILLPLDGSERALEAVRHVIRLVREGLEAEVVLANVQEPTHLYEVVMAPGAALSGEAAFAAGDHALQWGCRLLDEAELPYETHVLSSGDPAGALAELAEEEGCDLIVLGARGLGAVQAAVLGSVSQALVHAATVPVTIVKPVEPD